ncbi:MAG: regulatory protein RecX [Clostridia bacterium]|nr:regulatory protein RecX [Clostridia bacterium]
MAWRKAKNDLAGAAERVLSAALQYLARRDYTIAELRGKLLDRGADAERVSEVIARLRRERYLDDARYALAYTRDRREFRPCGASAIRHELARRGVAAELIDAALSAEYGEDEQRLALRRLLEKEPPTAPAGQMGPDDAQARRKARERQYRRLLAKGFPQAMILGEMRRIDDAVAEAEKIY